MEWWCLDGRSPKRILTDKKYHRFLYPDQGKKKMMVSQTLNPDYIFEYKREISHFQFSEAYFLSSVSNSLYFIYV